eukprot:5507004-Pleurochrysis_carterae.AAC.1
MSDTAAAPFVWPHAVPALDFTRVAAGPTLFPARRLAPQELDRRHHHYACCQDRLRQPCHLALYLRQPHLPHHVFNSCVYE